MQNLPRPFFVLAPMDDVTDTVLRQIVASIAKPDLFFTEFVNVDGLNSPGREKLMHKLLLNPVEQPVIAQLWGLKPDNFYKATKDVIQMGFAGVDLNMGCPVKTVTKNGACAALINNRELAGDIIDATLAAAREDHFPVSVKTRVGFSKVDLSWPEYLLNKKLNMLSIHGRTAAQMSKVPADWNLIGQVREMRDSLSPETLMVGNGDVHSRSQALELAKKYKLDGVMIGRGIFQDPYIFSKDSPWDTKNKEQRLELFASHIKLHISTYKSGERRFETLRKFCKVYINGFEGAHELRARFMETSTPEEALGLLEA